MAAIISMAVGFVGAAVGTAVGAAIGGTILGISAATIGAVIGAGVAGGLLSMARGGDFGKGFLIGAVGAGIGSYASSVFGGASGAAEGVAGAADGTASAVSGAVEGTTAAAAPLAADAATAAVGDIGTSALEAAAPAATEGAAFSLGDLGASGGMSAVPAAEGSFSLAGLGGEASGAMMTPTPTPGLEGVASTVGGFTDAGFNVGFDGAQLGTSGGGLSNPAPTGSFGDGGGAAGGMEGIGGQPAAYDPVAASSNSSGGFSLDNIGLDASGAKKLAMGGLDSMMKMYQTNKLEREVNKQKPMTFEQFQAQYSDPDAYRYAAENMARAGRTGSLPVLLARMKNNVRGKYAGYLPGAQQQYLNNQAGIASAKSGALTNLFSGYASDQAAKGVA